MITIPSVLLRLSVAILLGACIGAERQSHAQPAGLRTNTLVALGTCLFMIISAYGFTSFLGLPHVQVDPSRIASYVVAGIGFLGAGTIFRSQEGEKTKGLTTAASIWVVAAIGLASGLGLIVEAILTTALTLIVLVVLRPLEDLFWPHHAGSLQHIEITATAFSGQLVDEIYALCSRNSITVEKLHLHREKEGVTLELACHIQNKPSLLQAIGELQNTSGVQAVSTTNKIHPG